ncbi:MAG: CAF17-like 4Fe-4S cluster assembly/insertion protein YgfZ [Nesterenkonia sp.]
MQSTLLDRHGAVAGDGPDSGTAAHYGQPIFEQRALEAGRAVVDLSNRAVVTVAGPDRLSWLTTLSSQDLSGLTPGASTELLMLDISGRIEHAPAVTDDGETAWLITEAEHGPALAQWLEAMKFSLRVEIADRTDDYAVLGTVGPMPEAHSDVITARWQDPWPQITAGGVSYAAVQEDEHPGADWNWHVSVVPRTDLADIVARREQDGWTLAGAWAAEALRIAAWRPRLGRDVDAKTIPHELDLMRTAVHMSKGCYKGQETVARVHNLGHPPRRLVFLHLDGSEHTLPVPGSDVLAPKQPDDLEALANERAVGKVTSVIRHHEAGPIALALVKRRADTEQQLVVRDPNIGAQDGEGNPADPSFYAAAQELIVRPEAGQNVGRPQGDFLRTPRRR